MEISLVPISQSPDDAARALLWALELWGDRDPNYSRQDWINFYSPPADAKYESWEGNGQELVFLAKRGEELVGTIALVAFDDLEEFRYLTPWIAAFIVNPDLRGTGIGTRILCMIERKAGTLGIEALHLWTEDQSEFYGKRDYQILTSSKLGNLDIKVMRKSLIIK
jgi:N-acetylglutamate synthase-like GNAT family acetyltransferase